MKAAIHSLWWWQREHANWLQVLLKVETDLTNPISIALEEMKEGKISFEESK